jgi:hypothetical protein
MPVLPPGDEATFLTLSEGNTEWLRDIRRHWPTAKPNVNLTFLDSAGARWSRMSAGPLSEGPLRPLPDNPAKAFGAFPED